MSASEPPRRSKRKATTAPNYVDSEGEEDGSQRSPNENAVTSPGLLADVSPAKRAKRSASPSKAPQTPAKTRPIKAPPTEPATRGASSSRSPRTPGSAKPAKVTKPPPTDPSTWRNSRIRPRTTVCHCWPQRRFALTRRISLHRYLKETPQSSTASSQVT